MLVSFLTHHLVAAVAGRGSTIWPVNSWILSLGIHFPQFQMQAGVTGINTVRIYNPVKQAEDHDPGGCLHPQMGPGTGPVFPCPTFSRPGPCRPLRRRLLGFRLGEHLPCAGGLLRERASRQAREQVVGAPQAPQRCEEKGEGSAHPAPPCGGWSQRTWIDGGKDENPSDLHRDFAPACQIRTAHFCIARRRPHLALPRGRGRCWFEPGPLVGLRAWRRWQHPDVEIPNRSVSPHYRLLLIDLRDHGYSKDILPEFPEYDFDIVGEDISRCD